MAIARALVKQPAVLLADEPAGNLDEGTRDEIMTLLEHLWTELRLTLVMVSHDSIVAARAQRIGLVQHGRTCLAPVPGSEEVEVGVAVVPQEHDDPADDA